MPLICCWFGCVENVLRWVTNPELFINLCNVHFYIPNIPFSQVRRVIKDGSIWTPCILKIKVSQKFYCGGRHSMQAKFLL